MVLSLTQFLGSGLGLPWTIYISLVPVQTGSRWSLHILFIYLFKIEDSTLVWDSMASSSHCQAWCTVQDSVVRSRSTTWSQQLKKKNGGGIYDVRCTFDYNSYRISSPELQDLFLIELVTLLFEALFSFLIPNSQHTLRR